MIVDLYQKTEHVMAEVKTVKSKSSPPCAGQGQLSNRELVDGLLSGDAGATVQFHRRYSLRISRWVWRLLGTDRDHDDLVQQIFVNILTSARRITKVESLDAWVDSVTIRTVRFELRKRRLRQAIFGGSSDFDIDQSRDTSSPFKQSYIYRFYTILDKMPADDRIVFVLRYLEKCSIEHIASAGHYSYSTAKRRLKRARAVFAKIALQDYTLISLVEECHAL
jgi:RNA polymerase sigma-70 factor, ECF subfamily